MVLSSVGLAYTAVSAPIGKPPSEICGHFVAGLTIRIASSLKIRTSTDGSVFSSLRTGEQTGEQTEDLIEKTYISQGFQRISQ